MIMYIYIYIYIQYIHMYTHRVLHVLVQAEDPVQNVQQLALAGGLFVVCCTIVLCTIISYNITYYYVLLNTFI